MNILLDLSPRFDWTISLGTVIHLVSLLVAGVVLYMRLTQRMNTTERRVARLHVWVRELMRVTPGIDPVVIASNNGDEDD